MTLPAMSQDTDFQTRWRNWQAKGVDDDRKRTTIMRSISVVVVAGLLVWLSVLLG
jgi:hypothetical protein